MVVRYGGTTGRPKDVEGALYGWVTTRDGALVVNEPEARPPGSRSTTPRPTRPPTVHRHRARGLTAVANGLLESRRTRHGRTTWVWDAPDPMASYLATATIGDFRMRRSTVAGGLPVIDSSTGTSPPTTGG